MENASKRAHEEHRGSKRHADSQRPDEDHLAEWICELAQITETTCQEILIFEGSDDNGIAEVFSPPRVVTVARQLGAKGEWSIDRLLERAPGER